MKRNRLQRKKHGLRTSLQEPVGVCLARDLVVVFCTNNLLDLMVYEVVEGVDVLLDQPPDFEESRKELILIL